VKTISSFNRQRVGKHRATLHALDPHRVVTARWVRSGREPFAWAIPKATTMGQLTGPWPSRPLWPWAAMKPSGIVIFFHFLWIYSNLIQIQFILN
jgi:hypothetical protein